MKDKLIKYIPLIIALIILYFLIYPNYQKLIEIYKSSSKKYLFLSFLSSFVSYTFMSLSLYEMLKIFGWKVDFLKTFYITLISTTVNYFFSSGGASGFALRMHLLHKRKVPVSVSLTTSIVLTAFIYLILGLIVMQSFILYFIEIKKINKTMIEGFIGSTLIFLVPFVMSLVLYNHRFRNRWAIRIFYFINNTLYQITKYHIPREDFRDFKNKLNTGIAVLHTRKYELPKVLMYVLLDWIFNIMVLYFAFLAVGVRLSISDAVIGFSFGILITVLPILPSGLGIMEFVLANFYSNLGISIETAIFASLVMRFFYYILPSLFSLMIFYGVKIVDEDIDRGGRNGY
jgi:uncharacterized protein (TIRG00374 family)